MYGTHNMELCDIDDGVSFAVYFNV